MKTLLVLYQMSLMKTQLRKVGKLKKGVDK